MKKKALALVLAVALPAFGAELSALDASPAACSRLVCSKGSGSGGFSLINALPA